MREFTIMRNRPDSENHVGHIIKAGLEYFNKVLIQIKHLFEIRSSFKPLWYAISGQ